MNAYVRASMDARPYLDRPNLSRGFENLIVSNGMLELKGPLMKLGQALSLHTDMLPAETIEELTQLQMSAPGIAPTNVAA